MLVACIGGITMETTYVMVKPDGVQRGLVGEIIQRFERKGLQLVGLKQVIRIGHMAGRSNIIWWLEQNGYETSDELVSHLFDVAKSQRKNMLDSEVETAVHQFLNR